jgi:tetratricopeptide (TPR) repeat protein
MRRLLILALGLLACAAQPGWAASKDAPAAKPPTAKTAPAQPPAAPPAADLVPDSEHGQAIDQAVQYKHCVALARVKPEEGWEESLAWASLAGGDPARHCGAIALIGLKQYEEAATRLEGLARDSHGAARLRAGMLAQAGQAWLLAKNTERAYAAQTAALGLVPGAPDLLIDRAETLGDAKNYKEALADLDQALTADPKRADGLTFRATAKRFLDDSKGAEADVAAALAIDPKYQDAWLESGMLKRLANDPNGARAAWMKVLEIAPNSPAGDAARRNIELLDVRDR